MRTALFTVAASALVVAISGCATAPSTDSAGAIASAEPSVTRGMLSPEEVVACMKKSLEATPVLHVTIRNRHNGIDYVCHGWMMGMKVLGETWRDGELVFATYSDGCRVQEFVPAYKFANGIESTNVLVEHDTTTGGWFCLPEIDFTCGPGGIATDPHIGPREPRMPDVYLVNLVPPTLMSEAMPDGRACYRFHFEDNFGPRSRLTWEFYADKATCKPVRLSRLIETDGKKVKDDVYDYTFEHLPDDRGIHWGLDPARLRKQ